MEYGFTPQQQALWKEIDDFLREEMKNAPPEWGGGLEDMFASDEGFGFHKYMAKRLGEKGWISFAWPKQYGGKEATIIEQMILSERMGYHNAPGIDVFGAMMLAPTLLVGATEDQKQEQLPLIANGERFWCQGWSEPNAGSDLATVTTRAIRDGDEYVVNGQKIWTSGAHRADWIFAVVRTDPEQKRSRGLSFLLIDMKSPGVTINPLKDMADNHLFNEVFFDNVRVPVNNRVGEEGQGWAVTRMMMNFERSNVGMFSGMRRLIAEYVTYCNETIRDGKKLSQDPIVRQRVAQMAVELEIGIAMSHRVAWTQHKINEGKAGLGEMVAAASGAKLYGSEQFRRMSDTMCMISGTHGQLKKGSDKAPFRGLLENLYQTSLGFPIFAGSSEIQRNIIAWTSLELPRVKGGTVLTGSVLPF